MQADLHGESRKSASGWSMIIGHENLIMFPSLQCSDFDFSYKELKKCDFHHQNKAFGVANYSSVKR